MNTYTHLLRLLLPSFIAALLLVACGDDEADGGGNSPSQGASNGYPAYVEDVAPRTGDLLVRRTTTEGTKDVLCYSVAYDPSQHHSRWVAFRFDADTRAKLVSRKDYSIRPQYVHDDDIPATPANDLSFQGYDHGHLCASADRLYSRAANDRTFYMCNMSPQIGSFNQSYWTLYEALVQTLGRDATFADTLYVVKGGTIAAGQLLATISTGGINIPVPKYYYMALLKVKNGNFSAIAFWMEHKQYARPADSNAEMAAHAVSIDRLEELTGLDFFYKLPDQVETQVEQQCYPSAWKL